MKKIYLLVLVLCCVFLSAQAKYYIYTNDDGYSIRILTYTVDHNYAIEELTSNNGKIEKHNSNYGRITNSEEERAVFKDAKLLEDVKTDRPDDFTIYNNKTLKVINNKSQKESRFRFYGSHLLFEDSEYNRYSSFRTSQETPLYKTDNNIQKEIVRDDQLRYSFYNLGKITLFLVGNKIYIFKIKELVGKMFPDSKVSFTEKNFANSNTFFLLDVFSKSNPKGGDFYGVKEYLGKEILPAKFEKVLICADAILVKDNGLWYFYDFYGVKIIDKGFKKILPLHFEIPEYSNDKIEVTKKGITKYAVLEKNQVKVIGNIYEHSKSSEFISYRNYIEGICGTRSGSYSESLFKIRTKDNTIEINQETYFHNSGFTSRLMGSDDKYITKIKSSFHIGEDFGKIEYLNKSDSITSFYKILQDRFLYFYKIKKEKKEGFYAVNFNYVVEKGTFYGQSFNNFRNKNNDFETISLFNKIEDFTSEIPLLNLGGDYRDYFYLSLSNDLDSNFYPNTYYKIWNEGKVGFYSPRSNYLGNVKFKYMTLEDLKNRFLRFEDSNGKKGWLSEDGEEFYDL